VGEQPEGYWAAPRNKYYSIQGNMLLKKVMNCNMNVSEIKYNTIQYKFNTGFIKKPLNT